MSSRALVCFWASTLASVLLLGSMVSLRTANVALTAVAGIGFALAFFVAAHIARTVGRLKKGGA